MFTASLYSEADAEFLMVPQSVVFVSNPRNLPYDDPSLIKRRGQNCYRVNKGTT
uniref:IncH1 plasmid conjugative transfer protein Orf4 n=1 Tax=Klebsiella pneumoniae TaxID=573 RepID=A0A8B0SVF9_KLEPN|nr:IncH1 plasmid conjugative transfer protein Orf4 [Klebsiella pneumoniae]